MALRAANDKREPVSEKQGPTFAKATADKLVHIFHISLIQHETASLKMCTSLSAVALAKVGPRFSRRF